MLAEVAISSLHGIRNEAPPANTLETEESSVPNFQFGG
jgi:hypothetical protein